MTSKNLLLFLILTLFVSCAKEKPKIVWTYRFGDVEMLYGNVKEIIVRSDGPMATDDSTVFYIGQDGKQNQLDEYFHGNHWKHRYKSIYDKATKKEKIIEYRTDLAPFPKGFKVSHDEKMIGTFSYDSDDRIVQFLDVTGYGKGAYRYNDIGDLLESNQKDLGTFSNEWFMYDNQHLMIKSVSEFGYTDSTGNFSHLKEQWSYKYKSFDSHNNWLIKTIRLDNGTIATITRKITYY